MSNFLPDYTSFNTLLATLTNQQVLALYVRRVAIFGLGLLMFLAGFALLVAGSESGRAAAGTAVKAGAAVATDGASLAAGAAVKGAKKVAGK